MRSYLSFYLSILFAVQGNFVFADAALSRDKNDKEGSGSQKQVKSDTKVNDSDKSKPKTKKKKKKKNIKTSKVEFQEKVPISRDKKLMHLVNRGQWKDVASRLEKSTKNDTSYSRNNTLLSFAYMFMNKGEALNKLSERLKGEGEPESEKEKIYQKIIDAFCKICAKKNKEAAQVLQTLPDKHSNDALVNFALAAVAAKNGKAGPAIEYSKRSVDIDPGFGWGFRTLGYLEYKWLGRPGDAEGHLEKALEIEPNQVEVRNMLVRIKLTRNDYDGAIDIARGAIKLDKKNPDNHLRLATIFERQWRFKEAVNELNTAIKINPNNSVYYRRRASIQRFQGDLDAAIQDQSKAVALSKSKTFDLIELANMNIKAGNIDAGIANLKESIESDPKSKAAHDRLTTVLHANKKWEDLIAEYKRVIKIAPKNADFHFDLAQTLMKARKDEEALKEYTEAANLNPKDPRPLRQLGTYYAEKKLYAKAIKAFRKALGINPTSVQDMVALGYCFAQDDNYLQSEAAFVTALALKQLTRQNDALPPSRADIIRTLASLLLIEGRYADARNQFESLYSMTRNSKAKTIDWFLLNQSEALSGRSSKDLKKMLEAYGKLSVKDQNDYRYSFVQSLLKLDQVDKALEQLKKIPSDQYEKEPKWNILKARATRQAGKLDEALELVNKALKQAESREEEEPSIVADALVEKARIKLAQKKHYDAEKNAKHALETYTKAFASYLVLADVNFEMEKYEKGIEFLKKALEQNPYLSEAYMKMGDGYMKLDKAEEALENYKKASEIYPGYVKTHECLAKAYEKLGKKELLAKELEQIKNMRNLK